MTHEIFAFAASFLLIGVGTAVVPGCIYEEDCVDTPERPPSAGPIGNLKLVGYDETLIEAPMDMVPDYGTVEVTGEKVVILYHYDFKDYRVEYQVTGPYY